MFESSHLPYCMRHRHFLLHWRVLKPFTSAPNSIFPANRSYTQIQQASGFYFAAHHNTTSRLPSTNLYLRWQPLLSFSLLHIFSFGTLFWHIAISLPAFRGLSPLSISLRISDNPSPPTTHSLDTSASRDTPLPRILVVHTTR